jgi:hypothetical protein
MAVIVDSGLGGMGLIEDAHAKGDFRRTVANVLKMMEKFGIGRDDHISLDAVRAASQKQEFRLLMAQLDMQFADIEMMYRITECDAEEPDKVCLVDFLAQVVLSSGKARAETLLRLQTTLWKLCVSLKISEAHTLKELALLRAEIADRLSRLQTLADGLVEAAAQR